MIIHKGQIIQQKVRESGKKVTVVAEILGMTRPNLYDVFKREDPEPYTILRIGKAIDYDFGRDFPELRELANKNGDIFNNSEVVIKGLQKDLQTFKDLYYKTLEENKLLLAGNLKRYFDQFPITS